ncbi:MAG: hypothetical protein ABJG33_00180 [Balneola sp.]
MNKIIEFLIANGYEEITEVSYDEYDKEVHPEFRSFSKSDNHYGLDINDCQIVFLDETGDFLHLPMNKYALLGALIQLKQISVDYIWAGSKEGVEVVE